MNAWRSILSGHGVANRPRLWNFFTGFARGLGNAASLGVYRIISPYNGTERRYLALAKAKGFEPETLVLEGGLKAHWVGSSKAERVLLYYHGQSFSLLKCNA